MAAKVYNKLVRDRIPEIIEASGKTYVCETLSDEQYIEKLNEKLLEEVQEYLESGTVEEMADIDEIMHAILGFKGIPLEEFQRVRMEKLQERGGFKKKILLKEVSEDE
ncbi:nucleoside triphosphate pyrophosphohydrolase [Caproiciproducens sp.]|uniref:nucleoside triphosphate pyrophosphohydrolase n=1 Tax=Caproiciproducens sp. TaxID=1954376 RepID=UPI00289741D0|nr:nucleoside triphosphate pyrophosphohydrolase [Caproiciproducens sp.]